MRRFLTTFLLISASVHADSFRFHLLSEPHTLDPQSASAASGNYLFHNLYRGLYRYHSVRGLILEGARACARSPLKLTCQLNLKHKWSDGQPVRAEDYVRSFRRLIDPDMKSLQSELILSLKNAREIWAGHAPPDALGVKALSPTTVEFTFAEEDVEFEYKLINTALSPWPPSGVVEREKSAQMVFSGPYKITAWKPGHWVKMSANKAYGLPANSNRPELEAFFLENDSTALSLYENGKINFLRRLAAGEVPRFKGRADFKQIPVARFDYVGFGPALLPYPKLREALTQSVDFPSFQKLFDTKTSPGCPSLPARFMDRPPCLKFQPEMARELAGLEKNRPKLEYQFSLLGGDDIARAAEWFQGQWKKTLNLNVELRPMEQTVYLAQLRRQPPAIFRKGVSLDRPTCLAAVELFGRDSTENYLHFDDSAFEKLLSALRRPLAPEERKVNCRQAVQFLIDSKRMIPLGEMYFTILASPKFKGWDLNELNQMDLAELAEVQPP